MIQGIYLCTQNTPGDDPTEMYAKNPKSQNIEQQQEIYSKMERESQNIERKKPKKSEKLVDFLLTNVASTILHSLYNTIHQSCAFTSIMDNVHPP